MCVQHAVRPFQTGSAGPRRSQSHNSSGVTCSCPPAHHQTPRPPALPTTAQAWAAVECRSRSSAQRPTRHPVCRAQKQEQEEDERDMVGGFDVDAPAGFLESEAVGIVFKVWYRQLTPATLQAVTVHICCTSLASKRLDQPVTKVQISQ